MKFLQQKFQGETVCLFGSITDFSWTLQDDVATAKPKVIVKSNPFNSVVSTFLIWVIAIRVCHTFGHKLGEWRGVWRILAIV